MKIFRHESCIGIRLLKLFSYTVELWFCKKNYRIQEHKHPLEDIKLIFIYGNAMFVRNRQYSSIARRVQFPVDIFANFTIGHGDYHYFNTSNKMLIFLNIARWIKGAKPTSASLDFELR